MKEKKQNKVPQLSLLDFCEGMGSDRRELSMLGQKKWDLVKLYLTTRLKEGGQFTYDDLAKRAVRFACIVSNTIEGMREELQKEYLAEKKAKEEEMRREEERKTEYERSSPEMKEKIYQEVLRKEQGLRNDIDFFSHSGWLERENKSDYGPAICGVFVPWAEYEKLRARADAEVATYTPTQRYEKGMEVDYADLNKGSQEKVYQWWLNEMKKASCDRRKGNVSLTLEEVSGFCERRRKMLSEIPLLEWPLWGEKVYWEDLNEDEREKLHQRYLGGDRTINNAEKGNILKNYHNFIIPKVVIDAWREEYKQKGKG